MLLRWMVFEKAMFHVEHGLISAMQSGMGAGKSFLALPHTSTRAANS